MDNPLPQQGPFRGQWYDEANIISNAFTIQNYYQRSVNLVPTWARDTYLVYGRPKEQFLEKREGLSSLVTGAGATLQWASPLTNPISVHLLDAIPITAVYDVLVVACWDSTANQYWILQVRPVTGTVVVIGNPTNTTGDQIFLQEISQASGGNLLPGVAVLQSNSNRSVGKGYYAVTSGGVFASSSLTTISSTNFPANQTPALIPVGRFQTLNSRNYVATLDGQIWASAVNDISTWTDSNGNLMNVSASQYPDQLLGLLRYKNHLLAMGTTSIEFFDDVGATPSPLAVTDQATIRIGCVGQGLMCSINDSPFWVAYGDAGTSGVWTLNGYTPTKISEPTLDFAIVSSLSQSAIGFSNRLFGFRINQRMTLGVTGFPRNHMGFSLDTNKLNSADTYPISTPFPDGGTQMDCYNIDDSTWWQFAYGGTGNKATPIVWGPIASAVFVCSAFSNPTTQAADEFTQYAFLINSQAGVFPLGQNYLFSFTGERTGSQIYDDWVASGVGVAQPLPIFILAQTNALWFLDESRKRGNKFKVLAEGFQLASGDTATYTGYLMVTRENNLPSTEVIAGPGSTFPAQYYQIPLPGVNGRLYANNLGSGRVWRFCYFEQTLYNQRLHAYEFNAQQNMT